MKQDPVRKLCKYLVADNHQGVDFHVREVEVHIELVQRRDKIADNLLALGRDLVNQLFDLQVYLEEGGMK